MTHRRSRILVALALLLAVSGCGRKGALEPPGAAERPPMAPNTVLGTAPDEAAPAAPAKPHRPFFLDILI